MSSQLWAAIQQAALHEPVLADPPGDTVLQKQGSVFLRSFALEADFMAFQGHFAQMPVLPALGQILMAKETAHRCAGKKFFLTRIVQAKFVNLVKPPGILKVYAQKPLPDSFDWRFHLFMLPAGQEQMEDASVMRLTLSEQNSNEA